MSDPYGQPEDDAPPIQMPSPPMDGQPMPAEMSQEQGGAMVPAPQRLVNPATKTAFLFLLTGAVGALAGYYLKSTWDNMHDK